MMTSLERVLAALAFKEADRVPVFPLVCGAARRVYGITYEEWSHNPDLAAQSLLQAQELLGYDAMFTLSDLAVEASGFGARSAISRKMWEEIEAPYAQRITDEMRKQGVVVALHNCGNGPYFDLMIKYLNPAVISYHYLPDGCQDRVELKKKYGKKVTLAGQIDCPRALFMGKPKDVMEECLTNIEDLSSGGGYILASGCEFPPNAPLVNARAMVEAAKTYGTYA